MSGVKLNIVIRKKTKYACQANTVHSVQRIQCSIDKYTSLVTYRMY